MGQSFLRTKVGKIGRVRRVIPILVVAVLVGAALVALVIVPARTDARVLSVAPGAPALVTISVPAPSWVTVHFDKHGSQGMRYWMDGPSGRMLNRSMMSGGGMMGDEGWSDSYSFWTWGGDFHCGAEYSGFASGITPVGVNMTSAIL